MAQITPDPRSTPMPGGPMPGGPSPGARSGSRWPALVGVGATRPMGLTGGQFGASPTPDIPPHRGTDDRTFVAVFQALDDAILNPLVMLAFTASLVLPAIVAVRFVVDGDPARRWVVWAFGLYLVAMVITMAVHEPLNLVIRDAGDPAALADPGAVRDEFHEDRWVLWHIVRTIVTTGAFGCLAWASVLHGRVAPGRGRSGA